MTFFMALRTVRTYDALLYLSKLAFYCLLNKYEKQLRLHEKDFEL